MQLWLVHDAKRVQLKGERTLAESELRSVGAVQAVDTVGAHHAALLRAYAVRQATHTYSAVRGTGASLINI